MGVNVKLLSYRLKMQLAKLGVNNRSPETIERCAELYYRGEKNVTAKLTNEQVLEIRRLEKFCSARELSERYPVTIRHISEPSGEEEFGNISKILFLSKRLISRIRNRCKHVRNQ